METCVLQTSLTSRIAVPQQFHISARRAWRGRCEEQQRRQQCRVVSWQVASTVEAPPSVVPSVVPPFTVPRLADVRPTASLTFKTQHSLPFGKVLKLVGEARVMGEWDCEKAPAMTWVEGDYWLLTLDLPAGEHEFKVVVAPAEGGGPPLWEHGPNRRVAVPEAEAAARGAFTVVWQWGDPKVMAEEERDMQELQQLMATLEQGWKEEAAAQPAAPPTHSPQLQQLSGMLEAERLARRAAEADRDELRRQAEATAAEASALVKNSARLRAEFEALRGAAGGEAETRVVLQAQRDQLAAELSASYEHRTALQRERDALAEQLWHAGERSAAFEPEKAALEARVRAAEDTAARLQGEMDGLRRELEEARAARAAAEQERDTLQHQHQHQLRSVAEPAGQLRAERDALADLLAAARQQLTAAQAEVQRLQEEARLAAQNAKVLRSLGLLLASMD